jgi:hypothetical protein
MEKIKREIIVFELKTSGFIKIPPLFILNRTHKINILVKIFFCPGSRLIDPKLK